jgi:hypothetical protein
VINSPDPVSHSRSAERQHVPGGLLPVSGRVHQDEGGNTDRRYSQEQNSGSNPCARQTLPSAHGPRPAPWLASSTAWTISSRRLHSGGQPDHPGCPRGPAVSRRNSHTARCCREPPPDGCGGGCTSRVVPRAPRPPHTMATPSEPHRPHRARPDWAQYSADRPLGCNHRRDSASPYCAVGSFCRSSTGVQYRFVLASIPQCPYRRVSANHSIQYRSRPMTGRARPANTFSPGSKAAWIARSAEEFIGPPVRFPSLFDVSCANCEPTAHTTSFHERASHALPRE